MGRYLIHQQNNNIRQYVGHCHIVLTVSRPFLDGNIVYDITLEYMEPVFRNAVGFQVLPYGVDGIFIQVRAPHLFCPQFQGCDSQDTAACSHIQHQGVPVHVLFQLADAQLGGLMHACSKGRSRVNLHQKLVLVLLRYGFPGRLNQNIVHCKGLKVLFPVVNPVLVLCLRRGDGPGAQIRKWGQLVQAFFHPSEVIRHIRVIIQVKTYPGNAFVRRKLRKNVNKHPLCLLLCQGHIVFDFDSFYTNVVKHAANQVYSLCCGS